MSSDVSAGRDPARGSPCPAPVDTRTVSVRLSIRGGPSASARQPGSQLRPLQAGPVLASAGAPGLGVRLAGCGGKGRGRLTGPEGSAPGRRIPAWQPTNTGGGGHPGPPVGPELSPAGRGGGAAAGAQAPQGPEGVTTPLSPRREPPECEAGALLGQTGRVAPRTPRTGPGVHPGLVEQRSFGV